MTYSFQPFLDDVRGGWYEDDDLLHRLLRAYAAPDDDETPDLREWGQRVSGPLRELAEESALPENRPRLRRYDAYSHRVDRIVLPASTRRALAEVEGRAGLGALHGDPFLFYARIYLYVQNGESGVGCSIACTDGMVRVLEALGDHAIHEEAVQNIRSSTADRFWHGAQFVTEIQGGSDVPANRTEAIREPDGFRIVGRKWFCSNINADYFLVTARPTEGGGDGSPVGLFFVPARLPGERGRNGHTVDQLKDKLGTRELATAEVTFHGARAYPVGPLDRGLSNLVRHVLVPSRFHCVLIAAASLRRARRIVDAYTDFRRAFGRSLSEFSLVAETMEDIRRTQERALACTFGLIEAWEKARYAGGESQDEEDGEDAEGAETTGDGPATRSNDECDAVLDFRILLSLCKPVVTRAATNQIHECMMLLGGNGIEERFTALPRLHRDAVIMETWEGPHNVLFTQALRDLRRYDLDAEGFLTRTVGNPRTELVDELEEILDESRDLQASLPRFRRLAPDLVHAFADRILAEI